MKSARRLRESLPAIGLGTFLAFDRLPGELRVDLEAVMRQFWDAGGRVVDTSPLYGMGEVNVGDLAARLGVNDQLLITNKIWSTGEYLGDRSHAERSLEISMRRLWRKQIDVMMCHSLVNASIVVPLLKEWRKDGRIMYAGVSHHELAAFGELADWVERGDLAVVQVHYSIGRTPGRAAPPARGGGTRHGGDGEHALREGSPVQTRRGARAARLRARNRRAELGTILSEVDRVASCDHLRAACNGESQARRRQYGRTARPAAGSSHACANAAPHGVDPRLRRRNRHRPLSRTQVSRRHRACGPARLKTRLLRSFPLQR